MQHIAYIPRFVHTLISTFPVSYIQVGRLNMLSLSKATRLSTILTLNTKLLYEYDLENFAKLYI
jgi:hypothetical protein